MEVRDASRSCKAAGSGATGMARAVRQVPRHKAARSTTCTGSKLGHSGCVSWCRYYAQCEQGQPYEQNPCALSSTRIALKVGAPSSTLRRSRTWSRAGPPGGRIGRSAGRSSADLTKGLQELLGHSEMGTTMRYMHRARAPPRSDRPTPGSVGLCRRLGASARFPALGPEPGLTRGPARAPRATETKKPLLAQGLFGGGADGTRTRGLRRDRPAL